MKKVGFAVLREETLGISTKFLELECRFVGVVLKPFLTILYEDRHWFKG